MKLSIVIPTYNHCSDLLQPCLESLKRYTDLSRGDVEIIVVANGCKDNTREYVESLGTPFKLIWVEEASGYTKSTNIGIQHATGEYVVLLNNDTIFLEAPVNAWINQLIDPMLTDPKLMLTGPFKNWCPDSQRWFMIFFCVCVRKEAFDKLGILDESFSPGYGEDTEFCIRLENNGYKFDTIAPDGHFDPNDPEKRVMHGSFPIYHAGNHTFREIKGNDVLLNRNRKILQDRYAPRVAKAFECFGFMGDEEVAWLAKESRKHKVAIEIGSWKGKSSRAIADNLQPGGVLYCIDTWNGSINEQGTFHQEAKEKDGDKIAQEFMSNTLDLVQTGRIVPLRMHSQHATDLLRAKGIKADMIFIDGEHTFEGCSRDIDYCKGLLADGALLCGHDFGAWYGVEQALRAKVNDFWKAEGDKNSIWFCGPEQLKPNVPTTSPSKIYDCFPFFNELDLLETRLAELYDTVDRFVIVEATITHGGKQKPLYFKDNLARFEKYLSKITHIVIDDYPALDPWSIERHQRDCVMRGLSGANDNDIVIISDLDEIPRAEIIKAYKPEMGIKLVEQDFYYYFLNCKSKTNWNWLRILPFGLLKQLTPCGARYFRPPGLPADAPFPDEWVIKNGGWHFSFLADVGGIVQKIEATAHQEYNKDEFKDKAKIEKLINEGKDLYSRGFKYEFVPMDNSFPKHILDHIDYFGKYVKDITGYVKPTKGDVYDCVLFYNELDLLEARLEELWEVVDRFIICEATTTFSGKPKPLYFNDNLSRFEKYKGKITYAVVTNLPEGASSWDREYFQRNEIKKYLSNIKDNDIIIIGDVDEIPRAQVINDYHPDQGLCALSMDFYYYSLNCKCAERWYWSRIAPGKLVKEKSLKDLRFATDREYKILPSGGWHFSFLTADTKSIIEKIEAFSHQEYNTPEWKNEQRIDKVRQAGEDLFGRPILYNFVSLDSSYPRYITSNLQKYGKYIAVGKKI